MFADLEFTRPMLLAAGVCLAAASAFLLWRRQQKLPAALLSLAALCAGIAASGIRVSVPSGEAVRVLVDRSESTRTAEYRDDAKLRQRLADLVGSYPYEIAELTGTPRGPAIVLSDGQTTLEPTGPMYCVVDPALISPADARVVDIVPEAGRALAIVENTGAKRELMYGGKTVPIPTGRYRIGLGPASDGVAASLTAGDAWPENDKLVLPPQPSPEVMRLACGIPLPGLTPTAANELPSSAGSLASTSILVMDANSVAQLSLQQQQAIASWVRNLGGSLVIVGQDEHWASLRASRLSEISPLAPDPPEPTREWVILVDSSGSMAQVENGRQKWLSAMSAAEGMLRSLPASDLARVGTFSAGIRWLSTGSVSETDLTPPANFSPRGPTNLDAAISQVLELPPSQRELLLLSDAEVELRDVAATAAMLKERQIRVSCLILSDGRGKSALEELTRSTGGVVSMAADVRNWRAGAREMAGRLAPARWHAEDVQVSFTDPLPNQTQTVHGSNEAFARDGARVFAEAAGRPMAAHWRVGLGSVSALAFPTPTNLLQRIAARFEQLPSDDRYEVTWEDDAVTITGPSSTALRLSISSPAGHSQRAFAEVAAGRYRTDLPELSAGAYLVIEDGQRVIARRSAPPRYPREFARIGTDLDALQRLALRTGGRVIMPDEHGPIRELTPRRFVSLANVFGLAAAGLIAAGVLVLRRRL